MYSPNGVARMLTPLYSLPDIDPNGENSIQECLEMVQNALEKHLVVFDWEEKTELQCQVPQYTADSVATKRTGLGAISLMRIKFNPSMYI